MGLFCSCPWQRLERKLDVVLALLSGRARLGVAFGPSGPKENRMIEQTITTEQKVAVTLAPMTAAGNPAQVDGTPSWYVQSGDATIETADGGLSAFLVAGSLPGDSTILVQADADLGEGVVNIAETILLHVVHPQAAKLGASFGEPILK